MDWKQAIEQKKAALLRIAAVLLSLASLAELTCARSAPVRFFVLWVLRRAEIVAQNWVMGEEQRPLGSLIVCSLFASSPRGSPADAMHLAESFRALARELEREVAEIECDAEAFSAYWSDDAPDMVDVINMIHARSKFLVKLAADALAKAGAADNSPRLFDMFSLWLGVKSLGLREFCAHPT